jgi:EAL domain-containing protein (putative c-di-GMP-specific phosphodiesterase class I)
LDAHTLGLEIKENLATAHLNTSSRIINELRAMGIEVLLDNFGAGSSSLLNLKRLAVDGFKIDKSFIQNIEEDGIHSAIVSMMVNLAHDLGLRITAEGVENDVQHEVLKAIGCDIGQGYLYSQAVQACDAAKMITGEITMRAAKG